MEKEVYFNQVNNYLKSFLKNIRHDDPLPVRAPNYKVTDCEIDGQIIDIVYHYLNHRECPPYIRSLVAHKVWAQLRSSEDDNEDVVDSVEYDFPIYEPVKLIQDVTNRANVILQDLQSKLSSEEVDAMPTYYPVSSYAIKNARRKMEDRNIALQDLNTLYNMKYGHPHAFYGVFDGHGGVDAAVYAAAHLHQYLIQNPLYDMDPAAALKHAFHITDTNFIKKAGKEKLKGGTTAVVALVREKRLVVAWLGDSQALLVRRRKPVQVVAPHKPDRKEERARIEDMGGYVLDIQGTWRVLGQLAVSRAIGDVEYKPFISSECDIKSLDISGDEDFLILGCDGLWDNLESSSAVNTVYAYLNQNDGDTDGVGRCLVEAAKRAGSLDNITAVVVFLRPVTTLMEEEALRIAQGEVADADQVVTVCKGNQPNFINDLFSPPPSIMAQTTQQTSPEYQPEYDLSAGLPISKEEQIPSATEAAEDVSPGHYSDSDEGIEAEKSSELPEDVADPTPAEVDAALAELDSLPGDGEDSSEDEEWVYSKTKEEDDLEMDTKLQTQEPLVDSSFDAVQETTPAPRDVPLSFDKPLTPISPKPDSPRTVEGFVTSVELNSPEEVFGTNLSINQSSDMFSGGNIEHASGPFSVYVSSSPEPASMDNALIQHQFPVHDIITDSPNNPDLLVSTGHVEEHNTVEIVHAQSMVEVTTTSTETESPVAHKSFDLIPDIMTQSFSGDQLPLEAYSQADVISSMTQSFIEASIQSNEHVPFTDAAFALNQQTDIHTQETESAETIPPKSPADLATQLHAEHQIPQMDIMNEANILANEPMLSQTTPYTVQPEQPTVEPIVEAAPVEPIMEAAPVEPIVEAAPVEPIVEAAPVEPIVEAAPVELIGEAASEKALIQESQAENIPSPVALLTETVENSPLLPHTKEVLQLTEPSTPTNVLKAPPKPAARLTSLKASTRTPVSRISSAKLPTQTVASKVTSAPKTIKLEDKKTAVPRTATAPKLSATKIAPKNPITKTNPTPRVPLSSRPAVSKAPASSTTSRLSTRKPTATSTVPKPTTTATSVATSTTTTRRVPISARTTTTSRPVSSTGTKVASSAPAARTTATTSTSSNRRPLSAPRPTASSIARNTPATKDIKNTTNKMLSSTRSTLSSTTKPPTSSVPSRTRVTTTRTTTTTAATKRPITNIKTNMSGVKSKIDSGRIISAKSPTKTTKEIVKPTQINGENKIVEEESSIEVKEKIIEENNSVSECTQEVVVNGNH